MKKYIILITILASVFISCDDELETYPTSSTEASQAFNTEGDFTNAVRGMYIETIINGTYYGGQLQGFDVMTDNLIISPEGRLSQQFRYEWAYDQNSGISGHMATCYQVIQNANFILENIDNLEEGTFKNNIMGEALGMRALAHFDIVRFFAKIPTQSADAGSSLAMPYITIPDVTDLPSRITVSEYYDLLVDDLTTAERLINTNNNENLQLGNEAVNAILANVYLHMGKWQNAIDAANKVTTTVADRSKFTGIWNDSNEDGVIFKVLNDNTSRVSVGVPYNQTANGIKSEYVPDYEFYQKFDDKDIRKTAYFETSLFGGLNYNHVVKWYSSTSTTGLGVVDAKVLRASEVMLIKAEALAELEKDDLARTALDAVRSKRYSDFVTGGEIGNNLKNAIALERRLELAFEGSRFSDIKRKGKSIIRSDFGHLADGTGVPSTVKTLQAGDDKFQLPIPLNEMNLNPNMVQNPGYGTN